MIDVVTPEGGVSAGMERARQVEVQYVTSFGPAQTVRKRVHFPGIVR